jgi:zinc finger protein
LEWNVLHAGSAKYTLEVKDTKDLNVRIVKSSNATVKFPEFKITIEPGVNSEGFVANVEKLINDAYDIVKFIKENEEDAAKRKKAWKLMDEILDVKEGKKSVTLIIEDPTGASAIISEKAKKESFKKKK